MPAPPADPLWLTRTAAAAVVALSPRQFDDAIRTRLLAGASRGEGRGLRYFAPDVVATWHAYRIEQLAPDRRDGNKDTLGADAIDLSEDALDSPGLERFRLARAAMAELDLAKRRGELVPRDELNPALASFASLLRRAGELLQRLHGAEAANILNEAVDEAEAGWARVLAREGESELAERDECADSDHRPQGR